MITTDADEICTWMVDALRDTKDYYGEDSDEARLALETYVFVSEIMERCGPDHGVTLDVANRNLTVRKPH